MTFLPPVTSILSSAIHDRGCPRQRDSCKELKHYWSGAKWYLSACEEMAATGEKS